MREVLLVSEVLQWAILLFSTLVTVALIRRFQEREGSPGESRGSVVGLQAGEHAPGFSATTVEGGEVTHDDFADRAVAYFFVASSCPACHEVIPKYQALSSKAAEAGVELVLVSTDDQQRTQALLETFNVHMPVIIAPRDSNPLTEDYKVAGTPAYYLIDEHGVIRSGGYPSWDWGEWKELVAAWNSPPFPAQSMSGVTKERHAMV